MSKEDKIEEKLEIKQCDTPKCREKYVTEQCPKCFPSSGGKRRKGW